MRFPYLSYSLLLLGSLVFSTSYAEPHDAYTAIPPSGQGPKPSNIGKGKGPNPNQSQSLKEKIFPGEQIEGHTIITSLKDASGREWGLFQDAQGQAWAINPQGQKLLLGEAGTTKSIPSGIKIEKGGSFQGHPILSTFKDPEGISWGVFKDANNQSFMVNPSGVVISLQHMQNEVNPSPNPVFTTPDGKKWTALQNQPGTVWNPSPTLAQQLPPSKQGPLPSSEGATPAFGWDKMPSNFQTQSNNWSVFQDNRGHRWAVNQHGEFYPID
jgi:hypothetical protein